MSAQNFEGTLTYKVDFTIAQKMIDMGVTLDVLKKRMEEEGSWVNTIETSIKNGYYKQLNESKDKSWVIYRPDSNMLYTLQEGEASDICVIMDASMDTEFKMLGKMPTVTLVDTIVKYNDYELKMVKVKWKMGYYLYLYSEDHFKTDPELFKGHIFDGFYEYLKIAKSFPVIVIKDAVMMTVTTSLISSSEEEIQDSIFDIPELIEDEELNQISFGIGKMMKIKQ